MVMNKRIMFLLCDGLVYQRGKSLPLHPAINDPDVRKDAESLLIASIDFLISDEQDNFYQIIALPIPGTPLAEAQKSFTVDIPERKMPVPIHDTNAEEAKAWIRQQRKLDREEAEEDENEEEESEREEPEEGGAEEEAPDQAPPVLQVAPAVVPPALPAAPEAPQPAVSQPAAPAAEPQPYVAAVTEPAPPPVAVAPAQLEVIAPVPIAVPGLGNG